MKGNEEIPWIRISIEAVAIVGSILIAFALDAWWDRSQARIESRERLAAVLEELESAAPAIEETLEIRTSLVENLVELRRRLTDIPPAQNVNVSDSLIGPIQFTWVTEIRIANAQEFLSTDGSSVIGGRMLKQAMRSWLTAVEDVHDDEKQLRGFVSRDVRPFLRSRFNLAAAQDRMAIEWTVGSTAESGFGHEPMDPVQISIETSVELLNLLSMEEFHVRMLIRDTRQLRNAQKTLAQEIRDTLEISPDTP
jgi:hypothetical protein